MQQKVTLKALFNDVFTLNAISVFDIKVYKRSPERIAPQKHH